MLAPFMRGHLCAVLTCSYLLLSQHMGAEGLWWRQETKPVSEAECRATLKKITTRPKVGFTKWYDVSPQQLQQEFGHAATPDKGTWLACWPEGTQLDAPDS